MKTKHISFLITLLLIAFVTMAGCKHTPKSTEDHTQTPSSTPDDPDLPKPAESIQEILQVTAIKIAGLEANGKMPPNDYFKEAKNFNKGNSGPFNLEEKPKTAHISIRVEKKKLEGKDLKIFVKNANSYMPKLELTETGGIFTSDKSVALSKGANSILVILEVAEKEKAVYHIVVEYGGGPGVESRRLIPGIYCPTMRRPNKGETQELLWTIFFTGWCPKCPAVLNSAGKTDGIAEKYASQGLRVVGIDADGSDPNGAITKWNDSGRKYLCYTHENNSLMQFCIPKYGAPFAPCMKEGKMVTKQDNNGNPIKDPEGIEIPETPDAGKGDKNWKAFIARIFGLK